MESKDLIKQELLKSAEAEDLIKLAFIMQGYEEEKKVIIEENTTKEN
jgi:hypothetical protein